MKIMNPKPIEEARDKDLRLSLPALRQAARRAREVAVQTGTCIVVSRDGVLEHIAPDPAEFTVRKHEGHEE
jgi:hypothetical protein